jgi:hypothetical protein
LPRRSQVPHHGCALALLAAGCFIVPAHAEVAVLLRFDSEPPADAAVAEMKRELNALLADSGIRFSYRLPNELGESDVVDDVVVVRLRGRCRMEAMPALLDERGPLALTHLTDGEMLPFSEVACDRVRLSIRSAMWGDDFKRADLLLGRALARVIAHELYHMLGGTKDHAGEGVAKRALTGRQLITEGARFSASDLDKLRR